jgi:hypothetical protein
MLAKRDAHVLRSEVDLLPSRTIPIAFLYSNHVRTLLEMLYESMIELSA